MTSLPTRVSFLQREHSTLHYDWLAGVYEGCAAYRKNEGKGATRDWREGGSINEYQLQIDLANKSVCHLWFLLPLVLAIYMG